MNETPLSFWLAFHAGVFFLLGLDLFVLNRKSRVMSVSSAIVWSVGWVVLSLLFCSFVWHNKGSAKGIEFLTGYLIEYSLSVDNIFVFVLLFSYFKVPQEFQHRTLFWGVLGALVMRGMMIYLGVLIVTRFEWVLYLFGLFLVVTGVKMFFHKDEGDMDPSKNPVLKFLRRVLPMTDSYEGNKFTVWKAGRFFFTPLGLVLIMVETTDLMFAVDSIPAIFAVTQDPFIVYTSNICAILGLRSLYFVLASFVHEFIYLKVGLALVLIFVGTKMLLAHFYKIDPLISLSVVCAILGTAIAMSVAIKHWQQRHSTKI